MSLNSTARVGVARGAGGGRVVSMTRQSTATATTTAADARWAAVAARDARADGSFVYAVRTTGVYCRPSCPARAARPANVSFHATPADAERAGFRACKRCRPDQPPGASRQAATIAALCRFIEASDQVPTLADLARRARLSRFHLHRQFKAATGVTPRAYAQAQRARRVRAELRARRTVTEAIYGAGFGSNGRFYASSSRLLGMTPTAFRAGGADEEIRFAIGECALGALLVAATDKGVCAIFLGDDAEELAHELERRFPRARLIGGDARFERLVATVAGMVERPRAAVALPLDIRGTAFQQRVWQALRDIPAGATATYADVARAIGAPAATRAVGAACGANPVAIAIPCHRVVRSDGDLSGYRWGLDRKRALLAREAGRGRR
jgi:AraC family transcriptional regulator of adaptative response/methylated-DNA-[protein]-cysteine methyltransferase